jgi:hypothetical protein
MDVRGHRFRCPPYEIKEVEMEGVLRTVKEVEIEVVLRTVKKVEILWVVCKTDAASLECPSVTILTPIMALVCPLANSRPLRR